MTLKQELPTHKYKATEFQYRKYCIKEWCGIIDVDLTISISLKGMVKLGIEFATTYECV